MSSSIPDGDPGAGPQLRSIIAINFTLLYAFCLGAVAWLCWPETAEGWRFGLFSILCGLSAFALALKGFGDIWHHIKRDIGVGRFQRGGRKPQSDHLAGDDAMRKSDMIE